MAENNPVVSMTTSMGKIRIELDAERAPITTKNFLEYVSAGHYDGLIFHRVIPGFMIQGGGMDVQMNEKKGKTTIKNEAANGMKNKLSTIAMARSNPENRSDGVRVSGSPNLFRIILPHRGELFGRGWAGFMRVFGDTQRPA